MPRSRNTPPERQRPQRRADSVRLPVLDVPPEVRAALEQLAAEWRCTLAEARRRCYRDALLRWAAGLGTARREELLRALGLEE